MKSSFFLWAAVLAAARRCACLFFLYFTLSKVIKRECSTWQNACIENVLNLLLLKNGHHSLVNFSIHLKFLLKKHDNVIIRCFLNTVIIFYIGYTLLLI